jgi:hypothetical protein
MTSKVTVKKEANDLNLERNPGQDVEQWSPLPGQPAADRLCGELELSTESDTSGKSPF